MSSATIVTISKYQSIKISKYHLILRVNNVKCNNSHLSELEQLRLQQLQQSNQITHHHHLSSLLALLNFDMIYTFHKSYKSIFSPLFCLNFLPNGNCGFLKSEVVSFFFSPKYKKSDILPQSFGNLSFQPLFGQFWRFQPLSREFEKIYLQNAFPPFVLPSFLRPNSPQGLIQSKNYWDS